MHLMVEEPARYVEEFVKAGADSITVHVEACRDVGATLDKIKSLGVECAISLNPETSAESALPYLSMVDMVLGISFCPPNLWTRWHIWPRCGMSRDWIMPSR